MSEGAAAVKLVCDGAAADNEEEEAKEEAEEEAEEEAAVVAAAEAAVAGAGARLEQEAEPSRILGS